MKYLIQNLQNQFFTVIQGETSYNEFLKKDTTLVTFLSKDGKKTFKYDDAELEELHEMIVYDDTFNTLSKDEQDNVRALLHSTDKKNVELGVELAINNGFFSILGEYKELAKNLHIHYEWIFSSFSEIIHYVSTKKELSIRAEHSGFFPASFANLVNLIKITIIQNNKIINIPPVIFSLNKLEYLAIRDTRIKVIPPQLFELKNLKTLDLRRNRIKSLPKELGLLSDLKKIYLSDNLISELPKELASLNNLKLILLNNNEISHFPKPLLNMMNLEELNLCENYIETIPINIERMKSIKILSLMRNKIKVLPEEVGLLSDLEELTLLDNSIKTLPPSIGDLAKLRVLNIAHNPIESLPNEVFKSRVKDLSITIRQKH